MKWTQFLKVKRLTKLDIVGEVHVDCTTMVMFRLFNNKVGAAEIICTY